MNISALPLRIPVILFSLFYSVAVFSQEAKTMSFEKDKIKLDGRSISLGKAKRLSKEVSTEAFEHFAEAQKMMGWSNVWGGLGGGLIGFGASYTYFSGEGNGLWFLVAGVVVLYQGINKPRMDRIRDEIQKGVDAYNLAVSE